MRDAIRDSVLLADLTSLRVGGPARYYSAPEDLVRLQQAVRWAKEMSLPVTVLGGGTNLVFHDGGFQGLVISTTKLRGLAVESIRVVAAAGERLSPIAWRACRAGLSGLEWACGIPGTVGGAIVMNAGTREGEIAAVLKRVACLSDGAVREMAAAQLELGYRTSAILSGQQTGVIIEAVLELHPCDPDAALERARSLLTARVERLPLGASAGSIFRNPSAGPPAGSLLEQAGCKGMRLGDARVSRVHANVIVNDGRDNARDVLGLMERMKASVREAFGIELEEEVIVR